jgi:uncharacterized membrane protein
VLKRVKTSFISGILVLFPLYVIWLVVQFLIAHVGTPAGRLFFGELLRRHHLEGFMTPVFSIISILVVIVVITFFGWISNYFLGRFFFGLMDGIIQKIPLLRPIYNTAKQIVETFSKENRVMLQQAVLVPFPCEGLYSVGFISNKAEGEVQEKTREEVYNVLIPTTPNPTTGYLVLVPKPKIIFLDMSVGDTIKMIISGGVIVPPTNTVAPTSPQ